MKLPNDTVPDPRPRDAEADTDPTSPPVRLHETPAQVDDLLGGIGARAPRAPQVAADSAGREAAQYQTVAHPVRRHETGEAVPAVIIRNDTQPLPPIERAARNVPEEPKSQPPAVVSIRRVDTTVPGARKRSQRDRRLGLAAIGLLVVVSVVFTLALRPWRTQPIEPTSSPPIATTSSAVAPTASTTAASTSHTSEPSVQTASAPSTPPAPSTSARPPTKTVAPSRSADVPRSPTTPPTHEPRPAVTPPAHSAPPSSTDHVRSI